MTYKSNPSVAVNFSVNLRTSRIKKGVASCLKLKNGWHNGDKASSEIPYGAWVMFFEILKSFDKAPLSSFWKCFVYPQLMGSGFSLEWNENVPDFTDVDVLVCVDKIEVRHNGQSLVGGKLFEEKGVIFKKADDFYGWFRLNEVSKNEC
jgi:hypothetical protein